ncbi:hypothetical protein GWI33_021544 [Rhynchophorus ferrugineus]|uniref:Uncharacterized protein n=1 Tax=Rhynchophorus ferrugineus TaxID=354439 RepID=A0A834HSH2_RHYFE|nr:hypothetical protein GWI33_021544 [Rhynchophorus ferrugineus]
MLNLSSISEDKNKSARQVLDLERETLQLRRELQDTRNKKEEADQKLLHLSNMLRRHETSDPSEDGKTSVDSLSTITTSSSVAAPPRVILSGPVTDL